MDYLISLSFQHRLLAVLLSVFAEQAGIPLPAFPLLLVIGTDLHDGGTDVVLVVTLVSISSSLADLLWFWAGRRYGRRVLLLLCRLAISPDSCAQQNERSFSRYGVATLVIAKFVPGLSTLARPMAGALGMSTRTFLIANLLGTLLWASSGVVLGMIFHQQILQLLHWFQEMGSLALIVVVGLLAGYIAFRLCRRMRRSRARNIICA